MALVITRLKDGNDVFGGRSMVSHVSLALDNSYPTGGYSLPPTAFGMKSIWNMLVGDVGKTGGGVYRYYYDYINKKLMLYWSAGFTPEGSGTAAAQTFTGAAPAAHSHTIPVTAGTAGDAVTNNAGVLESTGGQDLTSNTTVAATPAGTNSTSAVTFTGTAVDPAGLVQVANTTDVSAVTDLRCTAFGR